ncbi:partial Protein RhsC, partial [Myxococcaceae bacterium]
MWKRLPWIVPVLAVVEFAASANAESGRKARTHCPNLIEIRAQFSDLTDCPTGCPCEQPYWRSGYYQLGHFNCLTGEREAVPYTGPGGGTCSTFATPEWPVVGGPSELTPGGCSTDSSSEVFVMEDCVGGPLPPDTPEPCERGAAAAPPSQSKGHCVGDPVDLTTGQLMQTITDLRVGPGLVFTRHYASHLERAGAARTRSGPMGFNWIHGFQWELEFTAIEGEVDGEFYLVRRPLRKPVPFFRVGSSGPFASVSGKGSLSRDASAVVFTDADGSRVVFDAASLLLTEIRPVGTPPIVVSHTPDSTTFARGSDTLTITRYTSAEAWPGYVKSVSGGGEAVHYDYAGVTYQGATYVLLASVEEPDRSTPSTADSVVWSYTYRTPSGGFGPGLLSQVTRSDGPTAIAEWTWGADNQGWPRVVHVDEPGVEQPLDLSYVFAAGTMQTSVRDGAAHLLATVEAVNGRASTIAGSGGPGFRVPFTEATVVETGSAVFDRWHVRTDAEGRKLLTEAYARDGAPGRIVEGWVDHDTSGTFSAGDSYGALREMTWHPTLARPLSVTTPSPLSGGLDHVVTYDYDDPTAPGDTALANESPTDRLHRRIETGKTLDASGAVVPVTTEVNYGYDSAGRLVSVRGPRQGENYVEIGYDAVSGFRSFVKRYLDGPGSLYLETTYSNFDARGNPQTVTDPNGRATNFTYDGLGRVRSISPPWSGPGSATILLSYDLDGNLVRIDFPVDSYGNASHLRFGYDARGKLTFIADAQANALVWDYERGRTTRAARHSGFADLDSRGQLVGDSKAEYDAAGRLVRAFNPLFADESVFTEISDYDGVGNPLSILDENGKEDAFVYDALDRLEEIRQLRAATYETRFAYDTNSNVAEVTDAAAKATEYRTDDLGRLVEIVSPDTGVTRYLYDEAANVVTKIENATGSPTRTTHYGHDGLDRLTLVDLPHD